MELSEDILTSSEKARLETYLAKLGSDDHQEFLKAEQIVGRLIYTISNRYKNRKDRHNLNIRN
jgi:hypothetical protein